MAYNNIISTKAWRLLPIVLLGAVLVLSEYSSVVHGEPQVPCFYIFGDSLADDGNNNLLLTLAKANFPPYGIDFPGGATGRFTNNRTTVDLIAEFLGFRGFIPPFATAIVTGNVTSGVNYASGSAGIRAETGKNLGDNISFNKQLQNHRITVTRLTQLLGNTTAATNFLNKCLYSIGFGSNDYLNNYFLPASLTSTLYTPEQFANVLITQYSTQLKTLHGLGARKMVLNGIGQLGCIPYAISRYGTNMSGCVEKFNDAVRLFNAGLLSLVDQLNNNLTDATFIYINSYGIQSNLTAAGFRVINKACCPTQTTGACVRGGIPCQNRNEYVFYDEINPTDAANRITATRSYTASGPSDAYPFDISHLVAQ